MRDRPEHGHVPRMYTNAQPSVPSIVARDTLRFGLRTRPATTEADLEAEVAEQAMAAAAEIDADRATGRSG